MTPEEKVETLEAVERATNERIRHFLDRIAKPKICDCGRQIWMVGHLNGRTAPYTDELVNHFTDCPDREKFRTGR